MEPRHDLRRNNRRPCEQSVTVFWRDRGEDKFFQAKALDICELGLRLQMPQELPRQLYVMLSASKLGLLGHASVRHCARIRGSKFAVGVEFTAGLRWTPKD
jgi:hypothetical protein